MNYPNEAISTLIMENIQPILFVVLLIILISENVIGASVDGAEKRIDHDSYIDALHTTHAEDSLNCECFI